MAFLASVWTRGGPVAIPDVGGTRLVGHVGNGSGAVATDKPSDMHPEDIVVGDYSWDSGKDVGRGSRRSHLG